jgi:hypothetical protein
VARSGVGQTVERIPIHFAPQAVKVIEAVVLLVDDNDMLEIVEPLFMPEPELVVEVLRVGE